VSRRNNTGQIGSWFPRSKEREFPIPVAGHRLSVSRRQLGGPRVPPCFAARSPSGPMLPTNMTKETSIKSIGKQPFERRNEVAEESLVRFARPPTPPREAPDMPMRHRLRAESCRSGATVGGSLVDVHRRSTMSDLVGGSPRLCAKTGHCLAYSGKAQFDPNRALRPASQDMALTSVTGKSRVLRTEKG
jgi:hypothetical protein